MMDINQHKYYTIYNISFVFYIYFSLTDVYFISIWISIHIIYYIDYSSSFILSSYSDSFHRYNMYLYKRTCSYNVKYLVNYQYLKLNTKHGTVGTQCWVHKFNIFLNLDFTNLYLQIQTLYIRISPMYDHYKKRTIYHHNLYLNRYINQLFEYIKYQIFNVSVLFKSSIFGIFSVFSYHAVFCLILVTYMYTDYI